MMAEVKSLNKENYSMELDYQANKGVIKQENNSELLKQEISIAKIHETEHKVMILDTSNFIRLKPLNLTEGWKYLTTDFIVKEIRDEKAREFYELNKEFIEVRNPRRETMKFITNFAKLSNDLKNLSIPDLSILSLAFDIIKECGYEDLIRKEPIKFEVVQVEERTSKKNEIETEEPSKADDLDEGFKEVKSKKKLPKLEKKAEDKFEHLFKDEGEWITPENIDSKLGKYKMDETEQARQETKSFNIFISTGDFTVQNLAMKMGMPVLGVDGMKIRKIKNYILKCYACEHFIFDTSKLFCEECGYNTLMKIACSIDSFGKLKIYNKKAEARSRGTQVGSYLN
jgi:RNA-binding protein NOB1